MADRSAVSTRKRVENPYHPYLPVMEELASEPMRQLLHETLRYKKMLSPNLIDKSALHSPEMLALKAQFMERMKKVLKEKKPTSLTKLVDPRPVNRRELYERLDTDAKVLDVGCGERKRLRGLNVDVVTVDPAYDHAEKHHKEEFRDSLEPERVVTSFNVLVQGVDCENRDGIHIIPNHPAMKEAGLAKETEDGKIEVKIGKDTWIDEEVKGPVQKITTHSVGLNTFQEREIKIKFSTEARTAGTFSSTGKRRYQRLLGTDEMSLKMGGQLHLLEMDNGVARLTNRETEKAFTSLKTNFDDRFTALVELFNGNFYLLKIINYRKYRPFHSLGLLEKFCQRVKFKLQVLGRQYRLKPPIRCDIRQAILRNEKHGDVEGVVVRSRGEDYLLRFYPSMDLGGNAYRKLLKIWKNAGIKNTLPEEPEGEGIHEYEFGHCELGYFIRRAIPRGKNKKEDDPEDFQSYLHAFSAFDLLRT